MNGIALFADKGYQKGFCIHGSTHEEGFIGGIHWNNEKEESDWMIAQWCCKNNIAEGIQTKPGCFETPSQTVARYEEDGKTILKLELRASEEYIEPRKAGEGWVHLLLEQRGIEKRCPTLDQISSMDFYSEVKIEYCDCKMENPDPALHAASTCLFLTICNESTGDMYWFGIPYFDNRYAMHEGYFAEDNGKEDASHKLIFAIPQSKITDQSFADFQWITYKRDIYPDIMEGLRRGKESGFLDTDDCAGYKVTSVNFGWEIPGIFDASMLIRELTLTVH